MRSLERAIEGLDGNHDAITREALLDYLRRILVFAIGKYELRNTANAEKMKWGRLIVNAVSAGNAVLKEKDLEELSERIGVLEEKAAKGGVFV